MIRRVKPSKRNDLEIAAVDDMCLENGDLGILSLKGG
jgi:dTDP-glucose pyrophosphorylase